VCRRYSRPAFRGPRGLLELPLVDPAHGTLPAFRDAVAGERVEDPEVWIPLLELLELRPEGDLPSLRLL